MVEKHHTYSFLIKDKSFFESKASNLSSPVILTACWKLTFN